MTVSLVERILQMDTFLVMNLIVYVPTYIRMKYIKYIC